MKKYRYSDPRFQTPLQRARPYLLMIVGWNVIGYMLWKYVTRQAAGRDPGWENRSDGEKVAIITGSAPNSIFKHKVTLFTPSEDKDEKKS